MEDLNLSHNDQQGERHNPLPEPLQQTADALRAAAVSSSSLDSATKSRQRHYLMSLSSPAPVAEPVVVPPAASSTSHPQTPKPKRPWLPLFGGMVAVGLVAVIAVSAVGHLAKTRAGLSGGAEISRLLIPAAHAGDAFIVTADRTDVTGVETDSGFTVQSKVSLTASQLQQTLRIVPAAEVTVEAKNDGTFHVQPTQPLKPGVVYRLALAANVQNPDGSTQTRDFSWAMQTKNDLRVLGSIPDDKTSNVPLNTGIEFKFTYPNVVDLKPYFSITPSVAGTFERHGRSVTFVPSAPLKEATKYEIVLKKEVHVASSTLALKEDMHIRFETQRATPVAQAPLTVALNEFNEAVPGKEIVLATNGYYYSDTRLATTPVEVTGYALSLDEARALVKARITIPNWAPIEASQYADYKKLARNQAFQLTVTPTQPNAYGPYLMTLPKIDRAGAYVLKVLPKDGQETWILMQITNNAVYSLGDKDSLLLWAVNPSTQKPLSNLPVKAGSSQLATDAAGVLRLPLNLVTTSTATSTELPNFVVEVGSGSDVFLLIERSGGNGYSPYSWGAPLGYDNWAYLFIDRPIYRPADELNLYGFLQNRNSHQGVGPVTVKLQKQGGWWIDFFGREKVYQEQVIQSDAAGHFQGKFQWNDLSAGYYQVNVYTQDTLITSRFFEVREFTKPAYSIVVTPDQPHVYAGDAMKGSVDVHFYDGTPLARGTFTVEVSPGSYGAAIPSIEVTTDDSGHATYSFQAPALPCELAEVQGTCPFQEYRNIAVRSVLGEETDILGTASTDIIGSELYIDLMPRTSGSNAQIDIKTTHVDLGKEDWLGQSWANRSLKGSVIGRSWKQVQDGVYYDFFAKQTYPRYRYEQISDAPTPITITTDAAGKAQYSFKMEREKWYSVVLSGTDDRGRGVRMTREVAIGWYDSVSDKGRFYAPQAPQDEQTPYLAFVPDTDNTWTAPTFKLNEQISVRYQHGKTPIDTSKGAGTLFVTASRGIRTVQHSAGSSYQFAFNQDISPNGTIRAIVFENGHFVTVRRDFGLELESRTLEIEAKADQVQYLPGGTVKVHVVVTKKVGGERAARAKVAFAAIDKALSGVTYLVEEAPLGTLYGYVPDGVTLETSSHQDGLQNASLAGAEKGGGGGGGDARAVRRTFKDTAAFGMVETDANGEADVIFKAPDNLTTWRIQLASITNDVMAGQHIVEVPVSKALFVDAVVPARLLTQDKPVIKLRAYGSSLQLNDAVAFAIDAPSLGIQNQGVSGKAFESVYMAVDKLVPGRHILTIRVTTPRGTDALERAVDVVDTRYLRDEQVIVEAAPGATLPDIGAPETTLVFTSKAQASLLPLVQTLAYSDWSPRVDAQIVGRMMRTLLKDVFKTEGTVSTEDAATQLNKYLDQDGGVRLLPYSSSDPELSAEVAVTAPELFDQETMKGYFYKSLEDVGASRELQISSLAGLAALHEPVLLQLQAMAAQTDLSWRERLTIARGLMSAGDQPGAAAQLAVLLNNVTRRDNVTSLAVSDKPMDVYEATADAAALAAELGNPEAENLQRFITANWSQEAFPLLARARYLSVMVRRAPVVKADLVYTLDGRTEKSVDLSTYMTDSIDITADEARTFRVIRVNAPIAMSFIKRVPGRPVSRPEVAVRRTYQADRPIDQLQDGDVVKITLSADLKEGAQDGCYALRDHLPASFQPIVSPVGYDGGYGGLRDSFAWYPYQVTNGEVSYTVCKGNLSDPTQTITYLARVSSRGSYVAEAPSLQHLEYPSVSALGTDQVITIK